LKWTRPEVLKLMNPVTIPAVPMQSDNPPPATDVGSPELRHRLRTPLNHILGYCEILIEEYPDAGFTPHLEQIRGVAQTMVETIQHMAEDEAGMASGGIGALRDRLDPLCIQIELSIPGLLAMIPSSTHNDLERICSACRMLRATLSAGAPDVPGSLSPELEGTAEKPPVAGPEPSGRILVVDDDELNRDVLTRQLERQRYDVAKAASGPAALSMLAAHRFDIMLLDVIMPGMNGFEVLETVKRDPALAGVAVILVSALDEMDSMIRGIEAGAEDYLFKPVNPTLLRARIKSTLDRMRAQETVRRKQRLESIGLLAAGIAHDFNNLLTGIIGNAQLLGQVLAEREREMAESIEKAGERAAELTRQLLAYSGKATFRMEKVDPASLVHNTEALIHASLPKKIKLDLRLNPTPPITADQNQLRQALLNLLLNAREAIGTDCPGTVTIETGTEQVTSGEGFEVVPDEIKAGLHVWVEVRDSGCGMDNVTVSKMFEPFFTTKFLGRGLGLAAVAGIVRSHSGLLRVTSAPGKGTALRLFFPAILLRPQSAEEQPFVLVVDDEAVIRQIVQVALERAGRKVLSAESGQRALEIVREKGEQIGVVLLDWKMPLIDGRAILNLLRELRPDLKVIVSSGYAPAEQQAHFRGLGITGYLQKPYRMSELIDIIESASPKRAS